jgi:hypothetical protein
VTRLERLERASDLHDLRLLWVRDGARATE